MLIIRGGLNVGQKTRADNIKTFILGSVCRTKDYDSRVELIAIISRPEVILLYISNPVFLHLTAILKNIR